jgi:hypothetical protein
MLVRVRGIVRESVRERDCRWIWSEKVRRDIPWMAKYGMFLLTAGLDSTCVVSYFFYSRAVSWQ